MLADQLATRERWSQTCLPCHNTLPLLTMLYDDLDPQHLQSLYAIANIPGLDQETFDEVIRSACKFAEEGAFAMVQQLATYSDPHVRRVTAESRASVSSASSPARAAASRAPSSTMVAASPVPACRMPAAVVWRSSWLMPQPEMASAREMAAPQANQAVTLIASPSAPAPRAGPERPSAGGS